MRDLSSVSSLKTATHGRERSDEGSVEADELFLFLHDSDLRLNYFIASYLRYHFPEKGQASVRFLALVENRPSRGPRDSLRTSDRLPSPALLIVSLRFFQTIQAACFEAGPHLIVAGPIHLRLVFDTAEMPIFVKIAQTHRS